ncbi:MFS transporter [Chitinophaga sp. GCM10012297]|uniref:MFS transporter n=1 Tax=Chitinophaga chungangae TaxID=2821488 RepID=A0ABS3YGV7_9BACT|nr:MFS transporter [Chitinophaga chungangae]MBO9153911.1 MFS transporter [Chitinophaga chungangae]
MFHKTLSLYRSAYGGIPRRVWLLAAVLLINRSGAMVIPFLTIYLTSKLGFSLEQAGLIVTVYGSGAIAGAWLGGKLSDAIGFAPVQFWSLVMNGLLFFLLGQMHTFPQVTAMMFVTGVFAESFRPANIAAVAHYSDVASRMRSYSLLRLASNLGFSIGPAIGGLLATISYNLLFWTDGFTCITAAILLRVFLKPVRSIGGKGTVAVKPVHGGVSAYTDKVFLFFIVLVSLFAICLFQLFNIVPVYLKEKVRMSEALIGVMMSVNGILIALIEMVLVYKLENKRPDVAYMSMGSILLGMAYLMFNILPPVYAVAFVYIVTFTAGEMLSMPFMNNFWIHRSKEHNRGQYAGLYTIAYCVATIAAPTLGAFTVERIGFDKWWYIVGGICLLASIGFRVMLKRGNATPAPGPRPVMENAAVEV